MSSHRRGPWSQDEDAHLFQLVHTQGALNWVRIAQLIGTRSPKQCRERYHQNLKPSLNHEPISPEEGRQIERLVGEMGKRWAEIARRLHGRSDNAVKNWWNGSMNRRRRLVLRRRPSQSHNTFDERAHSLSFARPAAAPRHPLTLASHYPSSNCMDRPLPSPAVSVTSRAESVDAAPSLISDNGSTFSSSPRVAPSPRIELPPLSSFADSRRPSLPLAPFNSNNFFMECESQTHTLSPRFPGEFKSIGFGMLSPALYRRHEPAPLILGDHSDHRSQLLTAPSTPIQLPPLNLPRQEQAEQPAERDSRMHLSSLLG